MLRNATYYYYAASLSQVFVRAGVRSNGSDGWARSLAHELLGRQRQDGSWSNDYTDAKEDDPLVATPAAATALELCRRIGRVGSGAGPVTRPLTWKEQRPPCPGAGSRAGAALPLDLRPPILLGYSPHAKGGCHVQIHFGPHAALFFLALLSPFKLGAGGEASGNWPSFPAQKRVGWRKLICPKAGMLHARKM